MRGLVATAGHFCESLFRSHFIPVHEFQEADMSDGFIKEKKAGLRVEAGHGAVHFGFRLNSYFFIVLLHVISPQNSNGLVTRVRCSV